MRKLCGILLCFVWLLLLCGCTKQQAEQPMPTAAATEPAPTTIPTEPPTLPVETAAAEVEMLAEEPAPPEFVILEPEASGELVAENDSAVIDYSHTDDGYVMVRFLTETTQRLKVLVQGPETTYSYNLPQDAWTVFPLSDGSGTYQVGVYENTTGTKYAVVLVTEFEVQLADEFAPFLRPNQYVNYLDAEKTVEKGAELTADIEDPLEKVTAIYHFVVSNIAYDYEKAATVKSGYLPDLDAVLEAQTGICFDYAALMAAMLRSQEVPCKLVVGYAGEIYHAWISVWTEETGWIDGFIFFDGQIWKRMDPTFASSGQEDESIQDFIENGTYTAKYLY